MLDEDDLLAENRMWGGRSRRSDKGKEEMDENDQDEPPRTLSRFREPAPVQPRSQKPAKARIQLLEEEDDDDNDQDYGRARSSRRSGAQRDEPYVAARGARPVPWRVQEAASLVMDFREANLSARAREELTLHFLQHPHEFYMKDPPVVLWTTADTGTARIYCKEVVPISLHLLALAFSASFQLQVTPKVKTALQGWSEAIQVRPCRSEDQGGRAQPLGVIAAVQAALERAELEPSVVETRTRHYMDGLGTLDTREVCDPDWLDQHTKGLRAACLSATADDEAGGIKAKLARMAKGKDDL